MAGSPGKPVFHVPPGATAVFVPLDALPDRVPGEAVSPEDCVALLVPDSEVQQVLGVGVGGEVGEGEQGWEAAPARSPTTAVLLAELAAFASSSAQLRAGRS